jgi:hypothetical protein
MRLIKCKIACIFATLFFACPALSQIDSNRPDFELTREPLTAWADVNSVWITLEFAKTVGVPYIPDPCLDYGKIYDTLKARGINRTGAPAMNRNPDAPLPSNLRIKIYIHNWDLSPYSVYVQLSIARPIQDRSLRDLPFYAEVWHSRGTIVTAAETDLQEKINKAVFGEMQWIGMAINNAKAYSSKSPESHDSNQSSPKLTK